MTDESPSNFGKWMRYGNIRQLTSLLITTSDMLHSDDRFQLPSPTQRSDNEIRQNDWVSTVFNIFYARIVSFLWRCKVISVMKCVVSFETIHQIKVFRTEEKGFWLSSRANGSRSAPENKTRSFRRFMSLSQVNISGFASSISRLCNALTFLAKHEWRHKDVQKNARLGWRKAN